MFQKMKFSKQNRWLLFSFSLFILFSVFYSYTHQPAKEIKADKIYADTMIPKGYVLLPLELANFDSVSALIDQFGVVDIYAGAPQSTGSLKVASRVKILRAPLNPNLFAVLVPETVSSEIMKKAGPFWAVVQNRESFKNTQETSKLKTIKIEYYKGG